MIILISTILLYGLMSFEYAQMDTLIQAVQWPLLRRSCFIYIAYIFRICMLNASIQSESGTVEFILRARMNDRLRDTLQ